ncbi:Cyclic nucleotide-binding protein [Pseudocohnilembus persalinus]|uniref:Cyclic nucleotide-binding protein n=1 Tax=Pseudocohnilembus persalinus TaxID=266149 RepID=A0A0V0R9S3_PSEPJ|nr:Cyclic nucleotide-binding protein [Pseudocohnilembus persalinus]|eukprot:KRX11050.1 Cyclic nucleotide-binding protein [Pseudocohnilembus persalinus]
MNNQDQSSQNVFFISGSKQELINSHFDSSPISVEQRLSNNKTDSQLLPKMFGNKVSDEVTSPNNNQQQSNQLQKNRKNYNKLNKINNSQDIKKSLFDDNKSKNQKPANKKQVQPINSDKNLNNEKNSNHSKKLSFLKNIKNNASKQNTMRKISIQQKSKLAQEAFQRAKNVYRISNIKKQMSKALNETQIRKYKNLTQEQYQILNDRSIIVKPVIETKTLSQKCGKLADELDMLFSLCMCGSKKILSAQHWVNFLFNIIEFLAILITIFMYTLYVFYDYQNNDFYTVFNVIMLGIFTISMFLKCSTSFYDQGKEILDRQKIIKNYRKGILFYDLLGHIGLILQLVFVESNLTSKIIALLIFGKAKTMAFNLEKIEEYLQLSGNQVHIWTLFNLMLQAIALCHVVGAVYFFIGTLEQKYASDQYNNWIDIAGLRENSSFSQYIQCFYWALALITLIGTKGDTDVETVYAVSCLLMTVGMFAKILGQVSMVMEKMEESQKAYKSDKETMNKFFSIHNDLSVDLQGQLHNYLKYSYKGHEKKQASQAFDELSEKFPEDLKEQLQKERYKEEITKFKIINDNFSEKVIEQLLPLVKEEYYTPNQIIFAGGIWEEQKLYLVIEGEIELYQETGEIDSILKVMKEGDNFGELNFFTNQVPFYSARSCSDSFSTVLVIPRRQFVDILKDDEEAYEKFCMVADQMLFEGHSKLVQRNCFICQSVYHNETNCGIINYKPNKNILYARLNYSVMQKRNQYDENELQNQRSSLQTLEQPKIYQRKQKTKKRIPKLKLLNKAKKRTLDKGELRKFIKEIQFQLERQKIYQEISSDEENQQENIQRMKNKLGDNQEFSIDGSQISDYDDYDEYESPQMIMTRNQSQKIIGSTRKQNVKINLADDNNSMSRSDVRGNRIKKKTFGLNLNSSKKANSGNKRNVQKRSFNNLPDDQIEQSYEIKDTGTSFYSGGLMFEDLQDDIEKVLDSENQHRKPERQQSEYEYNEEYDAFNEKQDSKINQIYQNQQQMIDDLQYNTQVNNQKLYDMVRAIQINQQNMLQNQQSLKTGAQNNQISKNIHFFVQAVRDELNNDNQNNKIDPVFQDFEAMKRFKFYFPNSNYDNVLVKIRKTQKQKLSQQQQKSNKTPKPTFITAMLLNNFNKKINSDKPSLASISNDIKNNK